jgi:predicted HAD superfamily Cof-like phosphohydrolase
MTLPPRKPSSNFDDVGDFHTKFDLPSVTQDGAYPRHPDRKLLEFRLKFLLEEVLEFAGAAGYQVFVDPTHDRKTGEVTNEVQITQVRNEVDHAGMFDALIDEVYVAMGTAHLLGYPWQVGWNAVQTANMQKVRAAKDGSDSKRGSSFDVVKPEGWTAPDIETLLRRFGWGDPLPPKEFAHSREGYDCAPELCGGSRQDPCTYTPREMSLFEELDKGNNRHDFEPGYTGMSCEKLFINTDKGDDPDSCGLPADHPIHEEKK